DPSERSTRFKLCQKNVFGNAQNARQQACRQLLVFSNFARRGKSGIDAHAHGEGMHVAVVDNAALWRNFDGALLLTASFSQIVAMLDELNVTEPHEYGGHPKKGKSGNNEEPLVDGLVARRRAASTGSVHDVDAIFVHFRSRLVAAHAESHFQSCTPARTVSGK